MVLLQKWYMDVVSEDGTAFIGYAARLCWAGLRIGYASYLLAPSDGQVRERASLLRVAPPARTGRSLCWGHDALDVRGCWRRGGFPSIRETLLSSGDGRIDWACIAPSARARVVVGGRRVDGVGYVERLRMTISPAKLPFERLQWGRFVSPAHAVVWISWNGGRRLGRAWLDGRPEHDADVAVNGVSWPGGRPDLQFPCRRTLRDRTVGETLAGLVPSLARRLPLLSGMRETKWLSRGTLHDTESRSEDGWAIHEIVTWAPPPS